MQCFARMSTHATSLAGMVGASLAWGSDSGTGRPDRPHFTRYARATRADALKKAVRVCLASEYPKESQA
jgi:hypothetical protein